MPGLQLPKKRDWHSCFPVNFSKLLRTPFLRYTGGCFFQYSHFIIVHPEVLYLFFSIRIIVRGIQSYFCLMIVIMFNDSSHDWNVIRPIFFWTHFMQTVFKVYFQTAFLYESTYCSRIWNCLTCFLPLKNVNFFLSIFFEPILSKIKLIPWWLLRKRLVKVL